MRVLGIDPGTATTGWALVSQPVAGRRAHLVACDAVRTPAHTPLATRLHSLFRAVSEVIARHQPDVVVIEQLFFAKNRTTAIAVSHARGVVLLAAAAAQLPVAEYTPLEVKQALTGYGRADKHQVQVMLAAHVDAPTLPRQDDTADAIAVAVTHLAMSRNPLTAAFRHAVQAS